MRRPNGRSRAENRMEKNTMNGRMSSVPQAPSEEELLSVIADLECRLAYPTRMSPLYRLRLREARTLLESLQTGRPGLTLHH